MANSTLPAVKAAAVSALQAAAGLAGVQVTYGWPDDAKREHVFIGGTSEDTQEWSAIGARQREEIYGLELVIVAWKPGATQQAMTERAFVLLGVVETTLRNDPTLALAPAGVKSLVVEIKPRSLTEGVWDDGRMALVDSVIAVTARI